MPEANALSLTSPETRRLYDQLRVQLRRLGPFEEEVKKTSIHLARRSAFVGVHPRKNSLLITIKSEQPIRSPRIVKTEQVSKSRWHCELKLTSPAEIDPEFLAWAKTAYDLCL
jgi:predicted transport protein